MQTAQPIIKTTTYAANATAPLVVRDRARLGLWNKTFSGGILLEAVLKMHDGVDREVIRLTVSEDPTTPNGAVYGLIYRPLTRPDPYKGEAQEIVQDPIATELYVLGAGLGLDPRTFDPYSVPLKELGLLMAGLGMDAAWVAEGLYPTDIKETIPAAMFAMGLHLTRDIALTEAGYTTSPERQLYALNWMFALEETSHPARFK